MQEYSYLDVKIVGKWNNIVLIVLNRPKVNAINNGMLDEFEHIFSQLKQSSEIKAAIITAKGKIFSAGVDLKWVAKKGRKNLDEVIERGQRVFSIIDKLPFPVIAAVNGYAVGGGFELALTCDIRLASEKAFFSLPEVAIGIIPGWGGTTRLGSIVGLEKAKQLIFSGRKISAMEAYQMNLVSEIFPLARLEESSIAFVEKIVANAPIAVKESKKIMNQFNEDRITIGYKTDLAAEKICFSTKDIKRAMRALFFKKKPKFKGN
ncbi:MAG: enoyl-CoA hydratase/isomerase family protein [Candidatus Heimdallarchaeaceae archaeon]